MAKFWFGPLGRLMLVDLGLTGFAEDSEKVGGVHESLNGTRTMDVTGVKGRWRINLGGLDARALSWFEMAYRGALGPRLYLIDDQRVNLMTAGGSSAGSAWTPATEVVYTVSNGTVAEVANPHPLLPGTLDGNAVLTPGPISSWTWTTTITGVIRVGEIIPVRPGQVVTFSVYVSSGTPTVEFTPFAADLTPLAQVGVTTVIAGTPPRRYYTYTVPSSGVAAVRPLMRHAAAQASTFTGLQVETGGPPTPWVMGAGAPRVIIPKTTANRRGLGRYMDADLELLEA